MVAFLFMAIYFLAIVSFIIFLLFILWRAMRAHESVAESMRIIAERTSAGSQT